MPNIIFLFFIEILCILKKYTIYKYEFLFIIYEKIFKASLTEVLIITIIPTVHFIC